ncbi:MAG TPA: GNAT family N-acetyltransferase [Allosphingosinicella sp.]|uniref:GNAT family N-acetyltransferase n=1 Tax=Allosphingosinicella sp. TaxID=2823234 RepID=UPI002EDB0FF0
MRVRAATPEDAATIASIYAPYVTGSSVSFEVTPPDEEEMRQRIEAGGGLYPWYAAVTDEERLIGYAYATPFRPRPAYRYAVETSVYLDPAYHGRGAGRLLYQALIRTLEKQRFAQAIAAITLPNDASVRLHEALGFVSAGVYRQVGYKGGRWLDVGLWQRALAPATNPPTEPIRLADL